MGPKRVGVSVGQDLSWAHECLGSAGVATLRAAQARVAPHVRRTPMVHSPSLSAQRGGPVYLKVESQQDTGAFKLRGATHALLSLSPEALARGVVTASTGNHGRAVAVAAQRLGAMATVCMSALVPANKVQAIRDLGARVRIVGHSQDEAQADARQLVAEQGLSYVPPFDHREVILGQASLGCEIAEQLPEVGAVVIPLSGGGLFAGTALALKSLLPQVRTWGVSMRRGAAMAASLQAGRPVVVREEATLADSLGGGIGLDNRYTFALVRGLIDGLQLVDEAAIAQAMVHAYREEREVIEGGAAVGIAALQQGLLADAAPLSAPLLLVLSGRNVDMSQHQGLLCAATSPSGDACHD